MNRFSPALLIALALGDAGVGIPDTGRLIDHHVGLYQFRRSRKTGARKVQRAAKKRRNQLRNKAAHRRSA